MLRRILATHTEADAGRGLVCSTKTNRDDRQEAAASFDVQLTIHHGRHTFISHALAGGRTLAEVRDAAGHCNVSITLGYRHVAVDDDAVRNLFGWPVRQFKSGVKWTNAFNCFIQVDPRPL